MVEAPAILLTVFSDEELGVEIDALYSDYKSSDKCLGSQCSSWCRSLVLSPVTNGPAGLSASCSPSIPSFIISREACVCVSLTNVNDTR